LSSQMDKPSREELLYLADQEQHERGMMQSDNHGDRRASMVKEWALREAAASSPWPLAKGAAFRSWWERGLSRT
jgi:hypothetical protein